ncbi:NAD(P)-dependent dehydrogenase, short-chain alcohol dehydrogenase family [Roseivivax lentus]|uniref:NAD(P)-dependent dehydrogenase, short-chain alcohol dehydrogenase family n=1 Tax=Roseivivax lentus TaxID=633194 RepID=A0A1N7JU88_9RHOB|nr:SDR family NAD(P)-dependent oxidoreductase [Roseivivax lentus]SIS52908.1 NAD(P)-dependent dehydrogenase, short-chain alcohol dehydrogenase family [Roseivivax lentus]
MQISGHVAIISGGGSGLGAATARALADKGARVAIFDLNAEAAEAVAAEIGGAGFAVDVSDSAAVADAVAGAIAALGQAPRIAVNCAGIAPAAKVVGREGKLATEMFEKVIRVNLIGTYNVMSHAAGAMATLDPLDSGERGVVINTASIAYQDGQMGQSAYAASKGGVAAMALPAARDLAKLGIRVMTIAPGLFYTPMMEGLPDEVSETITRNIPFPARLGLPAEYALLATQIVENPYLNAETIRLDAAVRLPMR